MDPFPNKQSAIDAGKADAEAVLGRYWVGLGIPVDPIAIAVSCGVKVYHRPIPHIDVYGAYRKRKNGPPEIFIEASDSMNRKRFTCAHELGHFWRFREAPELERVDLRSRVSSQGSDLEEVYANAFAANLLMPAEKVIERKAAHGVPVGRLLVQALAQEFQVSADAMGYRLTNIGIR